MAQGGGCSVPFCPQATCGGGHAGTIDARLAPRPSPALIAPEAEVGPRRRNGAARFVVSGLCMNGQPKTGKSMRYNSRTGVRQPMSFRKHQVDCLRLWRLSSPWILKRILLAIFNIRASAERVQGLSRNPLAKGFRAKAGRGDVWGLHTGVFCQVELSKRWTTSNEHQHAGMPAERGAGAPRASPATQGNMPRPSPFIRVAE